MAILVNSTFDPFSYKDYSEFIQPKVEDKDLTRLNNLQTDIYKAKDLLDPNKDADLIEDLNTLNTWIDESANKILNGSPQIANYQDYLSINQLFQDRISGLNAKYADRARRRATLTDDIITDLDLYGPLSEYDPEKAANAPTASKKAIATQTANMINNAVKNSIETTRFVDPDTNQIIAQTTGGFSQEDINKVLEYLDTNRGSLDALDVDDQLKGIIRTVRENYPGNWSSKSALEIDQAIKTGIRSSQWNYAKETSKNKPRTSTGGGGGSSSKSSKKASPGWSWARKTADEDLWTWADDEGNVDTMKSLRRYKDVFYDSLGNPVYGPKNDDGTDNPPEKWLQKKPGELTLQKRKEEEEKKKAEKRETEQTAKTFLTPPTPPVKRYYYTASGQHDTNKGEIDKIKEQGRVIRAEEIPTRYAEKIAKDYGIKPESWSKYISDFNKHYTIYELDGHITLVPKKGAAPEEATKTVDLS